MPGNPFVIYDGPTVIRQEGTMTGGGTSAGGIAISGTPTVGQVLTATSATAAHWAAGGGGSLPSQWTVGAGGGLTITPTADETPLRVNNDEGAADGLFRVGSDGGVTIVPNTASGGNALEVTDGGGTHELIVATSDNKLGFYNTGGQAPVAQQTGVPVSAAGIHAALVALGLITA